MGARLHLQIEVPCRIHPEVRYAGYTIAPLLLPVPHREPQGLAVFHPIRNDIPETANVPAVRSIKME